MAVRLPRLWDAYQTLDIMTRGRRPMKCVAKCVGGDNPGRRCNWDIISDLARVENLLQAMETRPPREALPFLEELVRLSLCQEVHKKYQEQADRIIEKWTRAIHEALGQYNGSLQPEVRFQDPYRDYLQGVNESEWAASNSGENEWTAMQRSYEQMTVERDTLSRQAAELASKLHEAEEHLIHLSQELDQAQRECTPLSKQVETLTTQLDSEARSSNKYRAEAQTQHTLLSNIVEGLRSQLNHTQQQSKTLAADLRQAIYSQTMLSAENATLHSQWETEHETCAKLSAELEKLQLNHTETEILRTELARQSQATAEWRQAQSDLKISAKAHDALRISSAQKEQDLSSSIATLTGQLNAERKTSDGLRQELTVTQSSLLETQAKLETLQRDIETPKTTAAEKDTVAFAVSEQKRHPTKKLSVGFVGTVKTWREEFIAWIKSGRVRNRGASGDGVEMV
jgi:myosin heavy subunit